MESTSAVPSRSSKRRNNGVMRNDENSDDADPLATINGDYPDFVNSTRRRRTEKLKRNMAVVLEENLDEEPNEPSRVDNDEPAITGEDLHRNEQIVAQMADVMKKLSTVNAFSNPLLDSLPKVIKTEPLQSVGTMLDASAKIYAFRVDHTHQECFIVRKDIGDEKELKKMKPERVEENDDQDITLQEAGPDKTIDENEPEEAIDENQPGPSKKSKKPKKLLPVVDEEKIKELQAEMGVTIRRFRRVLELEDEVSTESATKRFQFFADSVVERLGSRRELVTYLERSSEELEMEKEVHDLDEPYYHKATVGFEEGSAQSLLLKRVQSSLDGRFLLLHNKWRNMDFERLSQPPKSEEEEADETENLDERVDAFCRNLQDRVADTADITIGNLMPLGDDIEDFDELLEESFPTTPAILRQRDVNDNEKTLRLEDNDQDDFDAGAPADEDDTLTFALQGEETVLDAPIGDVQELESIENEAHEKSGVDLGPPPLAGVLQEGQPPDQTVGEPRAVNEEPLDPGVQPVPDDSHWQNAPNAQEMAKKPDKKKRTESEALNDSGIADLSWEPEEEADKDLIERLNSLRLPQKPSNVAEKREKIITPIGDTYDLRDNENASYKPTDVLRMKLFYSSRNGYYRYRKKPIAPPIIWVSTASSGIYPKPEVNKDVDDYTEFLQVWADMTLEQELNEHPAGDVINLASDVTFVPGTAENEHRNIDEDSLVDFNNDSFNHDSTLEEADIDFNATQNSAVHLDNMGRRSAELVLGNMGTPNDLDKTGMSTASNVKSQITNPNGTEQEYSDVEEVEINGMEIKIRPSRVKAIVVKKAMKKILSKNTEAKAIVRDGEEVVQDFSIQGSHSIGSLLAKLPDYLRGRTKRDINIVNAFSILLQMCNENNLFLHQEIGEDGMVTQKALSNFEICNSDPKMKASPCGKKRPFPVESPVDEIREQPHSSDSTNILN